MLFVSVSWLFLLGCQYQCKRLTGKTGSAQQHSTHVNRVDSSCFHLLRRIKSSLKALPQETAKSLVNCFVVSQLDYCNSLLAGVPQVTLDRLQRVVNAAARMLCSVGQACTCVRPTAQPSALATRATEDPVQTMPSDV